MIAETPRLSLSWLAYCCIQSPSPVTSIAYSPSGKLFAAGYQNGVLQLSKGIMVM